MLTKNLYSVKALESNKWEVTLSDKSHPVFEAHFPENPLLPAFLQIDIFSELIGKELSKIERCKFKQPILPNDVVTYEIIKHLNNSYRVNILKETLICSELKISFQ